MRSNAKTSTFIDRSSLFTVIKNLFLIYLPWLNKGYNRNHLTCWMVEVVRERTGFDYVK